MLLDRVTGLEICQLKDTKWLDTSIPRPSNRKIYDYLLKSIGSRRWTSFINLSSFFKLARVKALTLLCALVVSIISSTVAGYTLVDGTDPKCDVVWIAAMLRNGIIRK